MELEHSMLLAQEQLEEEEFLKSINASERERALWRLAQERLVNVILKNADWQREHKLEVEKVVNSQTDITYTNSPYITNPPTTT
jgi:hypothetical protein